MAEKHKHTKQKTNKVGSGLGVVPEDNIARALDPFGGAAAAVGEEDATKTKESNIDGENPEL